MGVASRWKLFGWLALLGGIALSVLVAIFMTTARFFVAGIVPTSYQAHADEIGYAFYAMTAAVLLIIANRYHWAWIPITVLLFFAFPPFLNYTLDELMAEFSAQAEATALATIVVSIPFVICHRLRMWLGSESQSVAS